MKVPSWFVRRVDGFLKALRLMFLAGEIAGYLRQASSQAQRINGQFRQLVDALQLLFVNLAQSSARNETDWDGWKAGKLPLGTNHSPTGPRVLTPRDRSRTRLWYGHGHLMHPGAQAAK